LLGQSPRLERLSHEPRIVLTGRPNAGKSTLLNALAGMERAVVSDVAGTTRDALSVQIALPRGMITLIDVAGLEQQADGDTISRQMQAAAQAQLESADVVILLIDASDERPPVGLSRPADLVVYSKCDLADPPAGALGVSVEGRSGLDELSDTLDRIAFGPASSGGAALAINARHVTLIQESIRAIEAARHAAGAGPELAASELRLAIEHLGGVLGNVSPDDVLGKIFSSFCIGK
jgi:tRNA modification GTPase